MKIGLLGVGTVGGGVVNVLAENQALIKQKTQDSIEIVIAAVRSKNEPRICNIDKQLLTEDASEVVNHPQVEVVLELIGGITFVKDLVETALKNGKHVVTANKALIANFGNELLTLAKENKVALLFEASVGAGIPIIKTITQGLCANQIQMIAGIINGTGNFILSEMSEKGRDFTDVLKEAQQLGYAEADPAYDVEGIDVAHKLAILSSLSFNHPLQFDQVSTEGISHIKQSDIEFADELGYVIKHLGIAKKEREGVQMRVHPTLVPKSSILGQVNGVMNAIFIRSNALGDSLYYGAGAGANSTASAVLADLLDISNQTWTTNLCLSEKVNYISQAQTQSAYYLRLCVDDIAGVLAEIGQILSQQNISMETVIQHPKDNQAHIAIITNKVEYERLVTVMTQIESCEFNQDAVQLIRMEELN